MQDKKNNINLEIIKTLSYSDVFDFPLSSEQIYKYLIGNSTHKKRIYSQIKKLQEFNIISCFKGKYFLSSRNNVSIQNERIIESGRKWKIARKFALLLQKIPSVKLIGVSGSLSMDNASKKDDIDLFFITSKNTLWISRFLVNIVLICAGIKRHRNSNYGVDQICPNMFVSEDALVMERNLFIAHEIAQLKVLVNKNNTYEKFLDANKWVLLYMPNAFELGGDNLKIKNEKLKMKNNFNDGENGKYMRLLRSLCSLAMTKIDYLFYYAQFLYMKKGITVEKISQTRALFHPKDRTKFVLNLHKKRYENYVNNLVDIGQIQPQNSTYLNALDTPGY